MRHHVNLDELILPTAFFVKYDDHDGKNRLFQQRNIVDYACTFLTIGVTLTLNTSLRTN